MAEASLNIQLISACISLTHNQMLEHRNNPSGRSFTEYSIGGVCRSQPQLELHIRREYSIGECMNQPAIYPNNRTQEQSEWPKLH